MAQGKNHTSQSPSCQFQLVLLSCGVVFYLLLIRFPLQGCTQRLQNPYPKRCHLNSGEILNKYVYGILPNERVVESLGDA